MNKPRLQISVTPATREIVARLARSQGMPASRVVSELLEDAAPMLGRMADTLESMATAAQGHRERIRGTLAAAEHEARNAAALVVRWLDDMVDAARADAAEAVDARVAGAAASSASGPPGGLTGGLPLRATRSLPSARRVPR
jgi:hypothetical protein